MSSRTFILLLLPLLIDEAMVVNAESISPKDRNFFETQIRPVLVKQCLECHSAKTNNTVKLDAPLPVAEAAAIVAMLRAAEKKPHHKPLAEQVIRDFERWIKLGAPWPVAADPQTNDSLWAFQPISQPIVPRVKNSRWTRDPLDRFVLARLTQEKLKPADDATPTVLIRRMYVDLTGLPPTVEAVEAFRKEYANDRPKAVEKLVDQLLASPHFGERWGRHWLDLARFGESNGNDGLGRNASFPHAWRYRDYVIEAFNRDTPYDRFLTEQIAGDLLPAKSDTERDRNLVAT